MIHWVWGPSKTPHFGDSNVELRALHSQSPNIYDLLQLLDNKAFSKLPSEAQKMNKKEATETHYNHSNR